MSQLRILLAFANQYAMEAQAATGFPGRAAYVYEHEQAPGRDLKPCRAFIDSLGNPIKERLGFPQVSEPTIDLSAVAGADVLCINAEFYGPEWELVSPMMRAIGLDRHGGNQQSAQERLIDKLQGFAREAAKAAKVSGLYGFAPLIGTSDVRLRVLMQCEAWMPSLYVYNSGGQMGECDYMGGVPKRETIPVLCGQYVYEPGAMVTVDQWIEVLGACVDGDHWKAERAILWSDCASPESVDQARVTGERMREAAKAVGIEIV